MSQLDDVEYANLAEQVRRIEELVNSGQAGGSDYLLKGFLNNAKARMEVIRQDEHGSEEKKEQKSRENANAVILAEMEHRLNSVEKEQYSGFLKLDYFTKANFEELDEFYEKTWDKLTEEGKSQMSYRVWEGVRQGEYSFDELPENVRKKEAERLYEKLVGTERAPASLANIPQQDRADFIREYEAGNEKAVTEVLNRESFSMNVSTHSSTEGSLRDPSVSPKEEGVDQKASETESKRASKEIEGQIFQGFTLAEATEAVKPDFSNLSGGPASGRG